MTLLSPVPTYEAGMALSRQLFHDSAESPVRCYRGRLTFHAFWDGELLAKHVISVQSCWVNHFAPAAECGSDERQLLLWTDSEGLNNTEPTILQQLSALPGVQLRLLNLSEQSQGTALNNSERLHAENNKGLSWYSDVVRYVLLYNYGGVWFDLDVLWLRPIDPLLLHFEERVMVYTWQSQPYPNGAVFISLPASSATLAHITELIASRNRGFGFQEAELTFDLPLDFLVLPCAWFDADWQSNPLRSPGGGLETFMSARPAGLDHCSVHNFHVGAFAYHWHNRWHAPILNNSCMADLYAEVTSRLPVWTRARPDLALARETRRPT